MTMMMIAMNVMIISFDRSTLCFLAPLQIQFSLSLTPQGSQKSPIAQNVPIFQCNAHVKKSYKIIFRVRSIPMSIDVLVIPLILISYNQDNCVGFRKSKASLCRVHWPSDRWRSLGPDIHPFHGCFWNLIVYVCVFVYFRHFLCLNKPELFAADFALVAINTLLVALSWFRHNLRNKSYKNGNVLGILMNMDD